MPKPLTCAIALLFFSISLPAFEGQLRLADGKAVAGAQVSVVGRALSARSDSTGAFRLDPAPAPPFTLVVIGPQGEIYDPIYVEAGATQPLTIDLHAMLMETMTVVASVAPNIDAPPAAATSVIGSEDIEQRSPEHVVDVVERTPGIQRRGEGPSAVPVVRGMTGGRTLILLDDARLSAERRAGPSATFLDPFTLASFEVLRGPGSVAYGSDAFGGVLHARPRDPIEGERTLRYQLSTSALASDAQAAGVELSGDALGGAMLASVHSRNAGDSEAGGGARIDNSSYRADGLMLRYARNASNRSLHLGLAIDRALDVEAPAADSLITRTYYPDERSTRLTASLDLDPQRFFDAMQVRGSISAYDITTTRERLPRQSTTRQISSAAVSSSDAALRATATRQLEAWRVEIGTDVNTRFGLNAKGSVENFSPAGLAISQTREVSIDDASRRDGGLFVLADRTFGILAASAGIRGDWISSTNRGGYFGDHSRSDFALSGQAAVTANLTKSITTTLQIASGYREPTLSDRYFHGVSGRGFVTGNPDLEPERSRQLDAAIRWQAGERFVALYAYDYRIRNLVERYRSGTDFFFRNRGVADIRGAELELATPLPAGFGAQAFVAIARGEADGRSSLDDIAPPNAHLAIQWQRSKFSTFLHAFYFADDDRPGPVEVARPSYTTVDLGAGWRFSEALDLRLHAKNIFDEYYAGSADTNAAAAPGRSIRLTLGGKL